MTNPRTVTRDTELVALAREANEQGQAEQRDREAKARAYRLDSAKRFVSGTLGVSANAFEASQAEDGSVHLRLGELLLRVSKDHSRYSERDVLNLSGGACPVCGEQIWSRPLDNLADLGGALASLGAADFVGGRPRAGAFKYATCKCDLKPEPDCRQVAIDKLASALADVLALGGYELGGPR
jgi:hypothetical protein